MRGKNGTESLVLHVHDNSLDKMLKLNIYKTKSKKVTRNQEIFGQKLADYVVDCLWILVILTQ